MPAAANQFAAALELARTSQFAAAAQAIERFLAVSPRHTEGLILKASILTQLGRGEGAVASADSAIRLNPRLERAHWARGDALQRLGRLREAVESYDRALRLKPDYVAALANRGNALAELHEPEAALKSFDQALAHNAQSPQLHNSRARVLNDLARSPEAIESADRAIALSPGYANAWLARGIALFNLNRYSEALESFQTCVRAEPGSYDGMSNLGAALTSLARYPEALETLEAAVAMAPALPLARYARAQAKLVLGDFAGGWADYDARWGNRAFMAKSAGQVSDATREQLALNLNPSDLAGRKVLLLPEQGVGDSIMFASMIPDVVATAAATTVVCDARLVGLYEASFPNASIVGPEASAGMRLGDFEKVVAIGSLGHAFRTRLTDFPGTPYLTPRPGAVEVWAARLGPKCGRARIGISWRGGTAWTGATSRSLTLGQLAPLFGLEGCEFVSLQYGDPRDEVQAANRELGCGIRIFDPEEIDEFEQLAGLIQNLDWVFTVQTAVVHLSGALGRRCVAMVPERPEWRYMAAGSAMPWYRSVQIVRQGRGEDWAPVVERAVEVVKAECARAPAHGS